MYYLSIDCANKSLAIGFYQLNLNNWQKNLICILNNNNLSNEEKINNSHNFLNNNIINIIFLKVIDLIPHKKLKDTTLIERSIQLKYHIDKIQKQIIDYIDNSEKITILIEYQMNANDKSRAIYNQLIYAFADPELYQIEIVKPTLKNEIYFKDELKYCNVIKNYSKNYSANKAQSKLNFLYFLNSFNQIDKIKDIKKKNIDDIADTFMQLVGYLKYQ